MHNFIETQNIAHFKSLLKTVEHPGKRDVLLMLLRDEEEKLRAITEAERQRILG